MKRRKPPVDPVPVDRITPLIEELERVTAELRALTRVTKAEREHRDDESR